MTTTEPKPLSTEQVTELLKLTEHADSVELKLTVPDAERRATTEALGVDPLTGQIRQVVFFDTPDLRCNESGVVVRARRVQGRGNDTVVKLRPVVPDDLRADLRALKTFGVEVDAMPGGFVCSASFKGSHTGDPVSEVLAGKRPVHKLFTKGQRSFYEQHAPEGLGLDDLAILGPITIMKVKVEPVELGRKLVGELWFYPDGTNIVELSTKCAPGEAFQVAAETRAYLSERNIDLGGEQQTKTKTALDYFSGLLRAQSS